MSYPTHGDARADIEARAKTPAVVSSAGTGSTETLDFSGSAPDVRWRLVLDAATVTLSFANVPTVASVLLRLVQDATGGRAVTWPASVKWANRAVPVLSSTGGAIDVVWLDTENGGTTWLGALVGQDFG